MRHTVVNQIKVILGPYEKKYKIKLIEGINKELSGEIYL